MRGLLTLSLAAVLALPAQAAPKYAKDVVPLSQDRKYLQKNDAPDFWRLIPYYVSQYNGAACSAASFAMIINAARARLPLTSEDKLVTQRSLAEQLKDQWWGKSILLASEWSQERLIEMFKAGKFARSPILMSEYEQVLKPLLDKNRLKLVESHWLHVTDTSPGMRKKVRDLLIENEKSDSDFIVLDLVQGDLTGDPEGGAHVAVVGAFDAATDRVLVLDPDREWYEPYWTTLDRLMAATVKLEKPSKEHHGLYHVKIAPKE